MWVNRPAYNSHGHGYSSFEDPYAREVSRERAARERETLARRAEYLRWQQMQDAARSPYNSYLSDDEDDSFIPNPYDPRAHHYVTQEDLERQQIFERQRQLELARQAELNRRREAERARELAEHMSEVRFCSSESSVLRSAWTDRPSPFSSSPHPPQHPTSLFLSLHQGDTLP